VFNNGHHIGVYVTSSGKEAYAAHPKYGVWKEKSPYGRKFMGIERTTFVIGPDGRIKKIFGKVKVKGHAAAVLDSL
jgi:peroxiredoxin Q/BCP